MHSVSIAFPIFGEGFIINPPRYISIFGFNLYLYGILIAIGFLIALLYLQKRRDAFGLSSSTVSDMVIIAIPSGIIGARLYYIIFNPANFFGEAGSFANIINLRQGGLAIYGGVLGAAVAYFIYSRVKKIPMPKLADAGAFGIFFGLMIGRWGNFINREAFGVETTLPWRMGLITETAAIYVHPTFLYESLWNLLGLILLHCFSKARKAKYYGQLFLLFVTWYGFGRFWIEGLRTDSLFLGGSDIRVSQLLAGASFVIAVAALIWNRARGLETIVYASEETETPAEAPVKGNPVPDEPIKETFNQDETASDETEQTEPDNED